MRNILFLLFFVTVISKKFSFKFINTPIYKSIPICLFHSVILLQSNSDLDKPNNEKNDRFVIDFCPVEDITEPTVILKLLQGKKIQGIVRLVKEPHKTIFREQIINNFYSKKNTFFENSNIEITNENLKELEKIDPDLVFIIKSWGTSFQIYNRNCRNFSNFLYRNYF